MFAILDLPALRLTLVLTISARRPKFGHHLFRDRALESGGSLSNSFMFTGQYYDVEIAEYYLRARQYDPHIARFTARDPIFGQFQEPLTLHKYLYCQNEPIDRIDPMGLAYFPYENKHYNERQTRTVINKAVEDTSEWWNPAAWGRAFGGFAAEYDYSHFWNDPVRRGTTFIAGGDAMGMHEFTNYLLGYCAYYNAPSGYQETYLNVAWTFGDIYGFAACADYRSPLWQKLLGGEKAPYKFWPWDNWGHKYYMVKGALDANRENFTGLGAQLDRIVLGAALWNLDILRQFDYFDFGEAYIP